MERAWQNGCEVYHGTNRLRQQQPRNVVLPAQVTSHRIACLAWAHVRRQKFGPGSFQQATDFTSDVPIGTGDNHNTLLAV
jgi:hypothetical protein